MELNLYVVSRHASKDTYPFTELNISNFQVMTIHETKTNKLLDQERSSKISSKDGDSESEVLNILRRLGSTLSCTKEDESLIEQEVLKVTMTHNESFIGSGLKDTGDYHELNGEVCRDCKSRTMQLDGTAPIHVHSEFNWHGIFSDLNERVSTNKTKLKVLQNRSAKQLNHTLK
jgi:hypothetical protein